MAFQKTSDYAVGDVNFTSFMNSLDTTRRGGSSITLSNYDNDSAPVVKVGSWFENNGALYEVITGDETPTGYSGISNSTTFYLYYDDSGDEFIYSSTAPTWSDSKQGWYNGNDRALFSMYKDSGGTLYQDKTKIQQSTFERHLELEQLELEQLNVNTIEEKTASAGVAFNSTVKWKYYYKTSSGTYADLFAELSTWIPTTGKAMATYGYFTTNGSNILGIRRISATEISISYIQLSNGTFNEITFTTATAGSITLELMSSFDEG